MGGSGKFYGETKRILWPPPHSSRRKNDRSLLKFTSTALRLPNLANHDLFHPTQRNAIFYLARDKSVISQANKSLGSLSEHRTSFILPAGTPSCIIYMIGQAWKKHRAVQYSLCNWPLINSCSFPMTFLMLSLLDKSRNALQARARIQSASTNGVFTISKESRTLMPWPWHIHTSWIRCRRCFRKPACISTEILKQLH